MVSLRPKSMESFTRREAGGVSIVKQEAGPMSFSITKSLVSGLVNLYWLNEISQYYACCSRQGSSEEFFGF